MAEDADEPTEKQSGSGQGLDAEMRAINERLVIAAVRQQEMAGAAAERAESALRSVALYRLLARNFPNGMVLLFDRDLRHILADGRGLAALGLSKDDLEGRTLWEGFTPQTCRQIETAYRSALAGETTVLEVTFPHGPPGPGAPECVYHVCTLPVVDDGESILSGMAVFQDVTERRQAEEAVRWQAHHDPLTGLPNRALLHDRLDRVLAACRRSGGFAALLFLDLDGFKQINDTRGHAAGDGVLQHVAARLTACLRAEDTVARLGGDEFVVLLPGIDAPGDAAGVVRKIQSALALPLVIGGDSLSVTASVGISVFPGDGEDAAALMQHADAAMYRSKGDR